MDRIKNNHVISLMLVVITWLFVVSLSLAQESTPTPAKDFGDLPDTYSTVGEGAPFHQLVSEEEQIMLGTEITAEEDGQPDSAAISDKDEGVEFPGCPFEAGETQIFKVQIIGDLPFAPSESAVLGIWVDWNHDGQFDESEFRAFNVVEGVNVIHATAPDDYEDAALAFRFRLFAGDNLPGGSVDWTDYEGAAINGEVEDYIFATTGRCSPSAVTLQTTSTPSPSKVSLIVVSITLLPLVQRVYVRKTVS